MDIGQAKKLFGYADLPTSDQVSKDFNEKYNAFNQAKRQTAESEKKEKYAIQLQELIAAKDLIDQHIRQANAPKPPIRPQPYPAPQPQPRPSPQPRPMPTPVPQPPTPSTPSGFPIWPQRPAAHATGSWGRRFKMAGVLLMIIALMMALSFLRNSKRHMLQSPAEPSALSSNETPPVPAPPSAPQPLPTGQLFVKPFPWARVFLSRGNTSLRNWIAPHREPITLEPGIYTLRIKWPKDPEEMSVDITILPGRSQALIVRHQPREVRMEAQ